MKKVAIGLFAALILASIAQAQTITYTWDVNGPSVSGGALGVPPRAGTWDTASTGTSTNWSTTENGNMATIAWPGNSWPHDIAQFRNSTQKDEFGSQAAPDIFVSIVGTQSAVRMLVARGAYTILTNGVFRGHANTMLQVGNWSAFNTLHLFSDVEIGPHTNSPSGAQYYALEIGNNANAAATNNTLIFEGKMYVGFENAQGFTFRAMQTPGAGGTNKVVQTSASRIENGVSTNFSIRYGRSDHGVGMGGRYEVYSTNNTYNGTTEFFNGTIVTYVDVYQPAPGGSAAFGTATTAMRLGSSANVSTSEVAFLTGAANITVSRRFEVYQGLASNAAYSVTVGGEHTSGTSTYSGHIYTLNATRTAPLNLTSAQGGTVLFTGNILNSGTNTTPVNKIGLGTVELAGTGNNYTGTTTVTEGTLLISGKLIGNGLVNVNGGSLIVNGEIGSGAVTVGVGGTLGGTGTIIGPTTVSGTLSPGNSVGNLTFDGHLTLNGGSTNFFEVGGTFIGQYDRVLFNGSEAQTLVYGGALDLDIWSGAAVGDTFTLFSGFTSQSGNFSSINLVGAFQGDVEFHPTTGVLEVIPEPGTLGVLGLGLIATLLRRRMRKV